MIPPETHRQSKPLVYVPGMDGTGLLFHRQVPSLSRTYHVTTTALRDAAGTMDELVRDLLHTVVAASPSGEPVVMIGESFGGALAMSFALAHPERVRALVLLNSFPYFASQWQLRLAIAAVRVMPWSATALVRRLSGWKLLSRQTEAEERRRFRQVTGTTSRAGYLNRLRILASHDFRERLPDLRAPTLLLAADRDRLIPSVAQARLMASRMPDASLRVLAGHGHACLLAGSLDLREILADWPPTADDG